MSFFSVEFIQIRIQTTSTFTDNMKKQECTLYDKQLLGMKAQMKHTFSLKSKLSN